MNSRDRSTRSAWVWRLAIAAMAALGGLATVTWVNRDDDVHTVVSTTLAFRSAGLETDEAYSFKFTTPGVYEYFCTLHPLMTGKVIVK